MTTAACTHGLPLTLFAFIVEHPHDREDAPEEYIVPPDDVELGEIREVCSGMAKDAGDRACYRIAFAGRARTEEEAQTYHPARVVRDDERGGWLAVFEPGVEAWRKNDPAALLCVFCGQTKAVFTRASQLGAPGAQG